MPTALKTEKQLDLSGGENTVVDPYLLGPKQSQQAVNFILDEHGSLRVRDGTLLQNVAGPNTSQSIVKIYDLVLASGTVKSLAIQKQAAGNNQLFIRTANPWTNLKTLSSTYSTPDVVTFTNLAFITDGQSSTPWQSDGTGGATAQITSSTGTVPGGGCHLANHLGYLWLGNTATASGALDGPSSLRSSAVNDATSWPAGSQTFIAKDDGQSIQSLALFTIAETGISPTATLIVFKDFSTYEVSGVFGATSFAVQKVKSDMGCVAPRTAQFCSGFGIIRLTHKGFALFDGVNDTIISEEERPRIFGRDTYSGLNWTNINLSYAAQVANPPLYICVCPVSGSTLTRMFIYDLVRRSWTIATFANALSCLQLITDPGVLPSVLGGDATGGFVRRYFAGDADDDGTAIAWTHVTKPLSGASPMERKFIQGMVAKFFKATAGSSIACQFNYGPTAVVNTQTVTFASSVSPFGGYSVDAWGSTGYGAASGSQNITDYEIMFNILGGAIANNAYATLTGSGAVRLRMLEWLYRDKALSKRPTLAA